MSRLDTHISTIRNKLAFALFLQALAWAGIGLGIIVIIAVIGLRMFDRTLSHQLALLGGGVLAAVAGAFIYSMIRRPSAQIAAVKIDETLGLKDKYSTALYARQVDNAFAHAAVLDAEWSANNEVSLYKRFPVKMPRQMFGTFGVLALALLVAEFMPNMHLFGSTPPTQKQTAGEGPAPHHDEYVKQALPTILAPATMPSADEKIRKASADLNKAIHTDEGDELRNHRSVLSALQDYNKTMVDELKNNEKFQTSMEDKNTLSTIADAKDDSTPMGKAQNELKAGNLDQAMKDISSAVDKFNKMSDAEKQKTIEQAKNLAEALANAANDPKAQQKISQQLMQMGATQSQAQQMAATMQQAAQGNKQAQQQLQKMAQQVAQQMNNGQGPTQQQQQQIQQMMTRSQAIANSQMQAQALSQSAQQMASAMVQARAAASQHQGQQGSQVSKNGQQGSQQNQPGQNQGQQQGMAQAQQNMQQQLQQMQANAQDAQSMQAAANAAAQAAADAAAGLNGQSGQDGQGQMPNGGNGKNQNQGGGVAQGQQGQGGLGKGGAKMPIAVAPFTFKQELDPSKDNEHGKILASRYVKAGIDPGKSTAGLKSVAASAEKDAPDDIDQDHVPREAQQAEKDYFSAMQQQDGQQ